jgi:hypothetical protein
VWAITLFGSGDDHVTVRRRGISGLGGDRSWPARSRPA